METVILKPYDEKIHAVAEYFAFSDGIKIKFSVRGLGVPGMHKLFLMSSLKPANNPVIADTLELKNGACFLERTLSLGDVAYRGYYPEDIDTFVLAVREGNKYIPEAVGFSRLLWDVGLSFGKTEGIPGSSLLKVNKAPHNDAYYEVLKEIDDFCSSAFRSDECPVEGMDWYIANEKIPPVDVSAYTHLLTPNAVQMIQSDGFPLLFGVQKEGLTAFAHKSFGSNPFENADDCTVKRGDYYIVGVRFKSDGQYFEKIV